MIYSFFTNNDGNTLLEKFKIVFQNLPDIACFDALAGCLYLHSTNHHVVTTTLENRIDELVCKRCN